MARKNIKTKKQTKIPEAERANRRRTRTAQIFFALFAIILILSMVLSAVAKF